MITVTPAMNSANATLVRVLRRRLTIFLVIRLESEAVFHARATTGTIQAQLNNVPGPVQTIS